MGYGRGITFETLPTLLFANWLATSSNFAAEAKSETKNKAVTLSMNSFVCLA